MPRSGASGSDADCAKTGAAQHESSKREQACLQTSSSIRSSKSRHASDLSNGRLIRWRGWKVAIVRTPSTLWMWPRASTSALAEERQSRAVAEQDQPLGLDQPDVAPGDLGARRAVGLGHSRARRIEAGQATRCRRRRHPSRSLRASGPQAPGLAADRLPGREILERRSIAEQHDRRRFRARAARSAGAVAEASGSSALLASHC